MPVAPTTVTPIGPLEAPATAPARPNAGLALAAGLAGWGLAVGTVIALHGEVDLGSQALPIVLAAAWVGRWWPGWAAALSCVLAVGAFNWWFVPPAGSLRVALRPDLLLLATMLCVSLGVALMVARQRAAMQREATHAARTARLLALNERLRAAASLQAAHQALLDALRPEGFDGLALLGGTAGGDEWAGAADADERAGMALCRREARSLGPGTGAATDQPWLYLPLRGHRGAVGAAVLRSSLPWTVDEATRRQAQALCDQIGLMIERNQAVQVAEREARHAGEQRLRSTLLAAVSHDYRTPLSAILGAASALVEQSDRLDPAQRRRLAVQIVDEVEQLARLTDNALQLARLQSAGEAAALEWESMEELVGSVLARVRRRDPGRRVRARVEPGLPLVRCQGVLLVQLLENLVDNALKYSPAQAPVEILVRQVADHLLLAVRDRGPGIPPAWRGRIFDAFQRLQLDLPEGHAEPLADNGRPRGAGVGLAVCRAIAQLHAAELTVRSRAHGGSSFELRLPVGETPTLDTPPAAKGWT